MNKKRKLIDDLKALKANHKTLREFAKDKYLDKDGFAVINLYVNNDNLYNNITNPNSPELSEEIINYIDKEAYFIPSEYPIKVIFHSEDDLDDKYIENKLKEHYWKQLADKDDDLKRNTFATIVLFCIGIVLLSCFFILQSIPETKDLFNEIFSIAGSFSIWEAFDFLLINRSVIKIEHFNTAQLALLTVEADDNQK